MKEIKKKLLKRRDYDDELAQLKEEMRAARKELNLLHLLLYSHYFGNVASITLHGGQLCKAPIRLHLWPKEAYYLYARDLICYGFDMRIEDLGKAAH